MPQTWAVADNVRSELRPVVAVATDVRDRVSSDAMKCSITLRINETLASVGKATGTLKPGAKGEDGSMVVRRA